LTSGEPDNISADLLFERLSHCIESENPTWVQEVIFELERIRTEHDRIPDELLDRLLALLGTETVLKSPVAASVLRFFDVGVLWLTKTQRRRCLDSLRALSDRFPDGDALWAVKEICDKLLIAKG